MLIPLVLVGTELARPLRGTSPNPRLAVPAQDVAGRGNARNQFELIRALNLPPGATSRPPGGRDRGP